MLTGRVPFCDKALIIKDVESNITNVKYSFPKDLMLSDNAKDLISRILVKKESDRLNLEEILNHNFFKQNSIPKNLPITFLKVAPDDKYISKYPLNKLSIKS